MAPARAGYRGAMDSSRKDKAEPKGRPAANRQEFEVAYYTKELGRPLQRKMLQSQLARLNPDAADTGRTEAAHQEDLTPAPAKNRTWDDRAG